MLKINDVELEFDLLDADTADSYEEALKLTDNIVDKVKGLAAGESIRKQCQIIFDVFNTIFGEGTDRKIFGGKTNLRSCLEAFEKLVSNADEQKEELDKKYSKYSPNRAQKRAKK